MGKIVETVTSNSHLIFGLQEQVDELLETVKSLTENLRAVTLQAEKNEGIAKINKETISTFGKSFTKISESFSPILAQLTETNVLSYNVAKAQAKQEERMNNIIKTSRRN